MKEINVIQAKRFGVVSCSINTSILDAAKMMVQEDISCLVIQDDEGYLSGIISRADIIRARHQDEGWQSAKVNSYMNRNVVTVLPQDNLDHVMQLLMSKHIHRVVIVEYDHGRPRPLGVLSDADLLYHMVNLVDAEIKQGISNDC